MAVTGHHIYTRSWFERGSKHKNAGTFTVELTDGIFGEKTDSIVYDKLNPMYGAPVPKVLAPNNSGQSLLRIFHLSLDTTIVSRHWNVTDELTGRGIVTYAYSLIFRGGENEIFLKHPAKAFEPGAAEPYESFCARVTPDAPTILSKKYDPEKEDYAATSVFKKRDWINTFGFTQEIFVSFYASLCKAICGKGNSKVSLILPESKNSEQLILMILSLLPMFMKRKFGAASKWTGMMDGHSSKAVEGLHLLCYYNEFPLSDSKFPVFDLTGSYRDENIDVISSNYAYWVWYNLDEPETIFGFEKFMTDNFAAVLDKMPFGVIEACFYLWIVFECKKEKIDFQTALRVVKLITDNFVNSFARSQFISLRLKESLIIIRNEMANNFDADMDASIIQALCVLANNGAENAKELLYEAHNHFLKKKDFKKISITTSYFSEMLSRLSSISDYDEERCRIIMAECMFCEDQRIVSDTKETITKYCLYKRTLMLKDNDAIKSGEAYTAYQKAIQPLYSAVNGNMPSKLFLLPEIKSDEALNRDMFADLMEYDIKLLGYIPSISRWRISLDWLDGLPEKRVMELFSLYYSTIPADKKYDYMLSLEDTGILHALIGLNDEILKDIALSFSAIFKISWDSEDRPLNSDETWKYAGDWLERMEKLGITGNGKIIRFMAHSINLTAEKLIQISCDVSPDSIRIISRIYSNVESLESVIGDIIRVDNVATEKFADSGFNNPQIYLNTSAQSIINAESRREYWYKRITPTVKWALLMALEAQRHSMFDVELFLSMCREKRGVSQPNSIARDMADIFAAVDYLDKYPQGIRSDIRNSFSDKISMVSSMDAVEAFCDDTAINAFSAINDLVWKNKSVGPVIANKLRCNDVDIEILRKYDKMSSEPRRQENHSDELDESPQFFIIITVVIVMILLTAVAGVLVFCFGNGLITPFLAPWVSLWVPYILAGLLLISTVFSSIFYNLRK